MCRIFGSFNPGSAAWELRTVAALLHHGGPDAQSFTAGPGWALGNNRLSIMDPDGGDQPYRLGDVTVVFNGEIYNHDELRAHLRARGHTFADRCDGSVLPALYLEYGDAFTDHLDGMYAVAVADLRAEPRLLLATDESGMKSLYYTWNPADGRFRFASEIPALLGFADMPVIEDEYGLDSYLTTKIPFGEATMFRGVRVLPPAATAVVSRDGLRVTTRPAGPAPDDGAGRSLADTGAALRDLLAGEVARLLIADVPVATITSGGLDSSLITMLAARAGGDLHTFTIAYAGDWPFDERHFAAEVARAAGSTHRQVEIDPATFPDLLDDVIWHLGQPNADPITLSSFALFRAVRDAGFKVAITGDAADELFGGYARMAAAVTARGPWIPAYLDHLAAVPADMRRRLYTEDFRAALAQLPLALPGELLSTLRDGPGSRLSRICAVEQAYRLPAYHLRRVDHTSMANSVEARVPFCQPRVTRFAAGLPDRHRITPDGVKRALYEAARGLVPDSVLDRPKQPFTLPITSMLRPGQQLWTLARDTLNETTLRSDGRLRPEVVGGLFDEQARHPSDSTSLALWALMTHQLWRRQFFGAARPLTTTRGLA
jgi:asparagine synthase (glutamine-hydrolysing)